MNKQQLSILFQQIFAGDAEIFVQSPGRINIIGEHTDYNNGFVLPAAIDKKVCVAIRKRPDDTIIMYASEFDEKISIRLSEIKPSGNWTAYILGVVAQLIEKGYPIGGFEILLTGNIPIGAGLSSSAAIECATVFALNELFDLNIDKFRMVQMAQMAEHHYAGVQCGIMDQFASMFGKKDHLIKLDCRSLEYEYIPLQIPYHSIVLLNTNVKHALVDSEYNIRRKQCEDGVNMVRKKYPNVNSLRDVDLEMVEACIRRESELIYKRCHYVVSENLRLQKLCEALTQNNIETSGKLMFETHEGLRHEYDVSCPELDILVGLAKENGAIGARMVGGGFGGCTINLVKKEELHHFIDSVEKGYKEKTGRDPSTYMVSVEDGTGLLNE